MPALCVIPGDGIGQEVIPAALEVLRAVLPDISVIQADGGWECFNRTGSSMPDTTLAAVSECGAALFGAVSSPSRKVPGYRSAILTLRQELDLFANIRPIKSLPKLSPRQNVDMIIVRENTEDLYSGREYPLEGNELGIQSAVAERVISRRASYRIGSKALELASRSRRKRLTIVHKANIMPITDGLFRDSVRAAMNEYISLRNLEHDWLAIDEMLVDTAAYKINSAPDSFDMIVTTNMFGDILSDAAAHWCGGMGMAPSLNWGDKIAVAEPVHGSAPDIAGKGIANPIAAVLSCALLVRYGWEMPDTARQIEEAVSSALVDLLVNDSSLTPGLKTRTITAAILRYV